VLCPPHSACLAPAVARRDVIAERIAELETERASILAARRNGHQDDDTHGPRLVLIAADVDDLTAMLAEADTEVAPLRQAHKDAGRRILAAEQTLVNVQEDEVLRLTMTRANEFSELILQAVAAIDHHGAVKLSEMVITSATLRIAAAKKLITF
jgi:hypothetical protein